VRGWLVVSIAAALVGSARADVPSAPATSPPTSLPPGATRDPLDEARALEATLDYERALVIVDREIARGAARPDRLVELELLAGRLAAGIDHPDVAQAHFARALALAPGTRLPDGTSPKLTAPFDAAKVATPALSIAYVGSNRVDARTIAFVVTVGPDPAHVYAGLRAGDVVAHGLAIQLPADAATRPFTLDAIDEHGNAIAELAVRASPEIPVDRGSSPPASHAHAWWPWAIAAGGALAFAGVASWRFEHAQDEWNQLEAAGGHGYSELAEVESRGRAWGIAADVGFGVAAAAAVTSIVMLAISGGSAPATQPYASRDTLGFAVRF